MPPSDWSLCTSTREFSWLTTDMRGPRSMPPPPCQLWVVPPVGRCPVSHKNESGLWATRSSPVLDIPPWPTNQFHTVSSCPDGYSWRALSCKIKYAPPRLLLAMVLVTATGYKVEHLGSSIKIYSTILNCIIAPTQTKRSDWQIRSHYHLRLLIPPPTAVQCRSRDWL